MSYDDVLHSVGDLDAAVAVLSVFDGLSLVILAAMLLVFCRRRRHLTNLNSRHSSQHHHYEPPSMPVCFHVCRTFPPLDIFPGPSPRTLADNALRVMEDRILKTCLVFTLQSSSLHVAIYQHLIATINLTVM